MVRQPVPVRLRETLQGAARGRQPRREDLDRLGARTTRALRFASSVGEMKRDDAARPLWAQIYEELSDGKPGLFGAVTSRAEAQTMRFACLYALLDLNDHVQRDHLESRSRSGPTASSPPTTSSAARWVTPPQTRRSRRCGALRPPAHAHRAPRPIRAAQKDRRPRAVARAARARRSRHTTQAALRRGAPTEIWQAL